MADRMKITEEVPFTVKDFQGPDGPAEPDGLPTVSVSNPDLATVVYDDDTHTTGAIVARGKPGDIEITFDAESGGKMLPRIVRHLTIVTDKPVALAFDAEVGAPRAARKPPVKPPPVVPAPGVPPVEVPPVVVPPVEVPPVPVPVTVNITTPTSGPRYVATATPITLMGTATGPGLTQVSWTNDRGGFGVADGTTTWTAAGIGLTPGVDNTVTVTAAGAAGATAVATLVVPYGPPEPLPVPPTPVPPGPVPPVPTVPVPPVEPVPVPPVVSPPLDPTGTQPFLRRG